MQLAGEDGTVDASAITLSDMGTMNHGFGGGRGQMPGMAGNRTEATDATDPDNAATGDMQMPGQNGTQQISGQSGTANNTSRMNETTGGSMQFPSFGSRDGMEFPEGMEMPDGMENMFPGHSGNSRESFSDRGQSGLTPTQGNNSWVLLIVTIVILAAGLLFAFKFKR